MHHKTRWSHVLTMAAAGWLVVGLAAASVAQELQDWNQNDGAEVLVRGPLHEAFAEVVRYDPEPGLTVSRKPPQPIEEVPPEQKPEGEGYEWVGGYWGWDEDRQDFVWISGVWRIPPPGTQWVPGYWAEAAGGWQWVSGYWAPLAGAGEQQVEYLPQPPASLEAGPSSPAPTDDHFWVPGCWVWHQGRYVWRAGYWAPARASWVWIPARYVWTPGGCVYVPGHWDYTLVERGLSFCPVYFRRPIYLHVGFRFTPSVVIYSDVLHRHLFCRPRYGHYYFGDYYASRYVGLGIYPWFIFYHSRYAYEPFYTYHHWYFHDREPGWDDRVHRWYRYHRDHEGARPPHTFADFRRMEDSHHGDRGPRDRLAVSLKGDRDRDHLPVRLERISHDRLRSMSDLGNRVHQLADHRAELERGLRAKSGHGPAHEPLRATLPESAVRREAGPAALGRHGPPPARLDERGGVGRLSAGHAFTRGSPDLTVRSELSERLRNRGDEGRGRFEPPERMLRQPSHVPRFQPHRAASPSPSRSVVPRSVPQFREHSRSHGRSSDSGPRFSPQRFGGERSHGAFGRGHGHGRGHGKDR